MIDTAAIRIRYDAVSPTLDEKGLRFFAASEALAAGRGGIVAVSAVTGIARSTIGRGLKELTAKEKAPPQDRVRKQAEYHLRHRLGTLSEGYQDPERSPERTQHQV